MLVIETRKRRLPSLTQRLAAVALVWIACLTATVLVQPLLARTTFAFVWIAVLFAAWYAGLAAAITASLLAVLAVNVLLVEPIGQIGTIASAEINTFVVFVLVSAAVSALAARAATSAAALRESEARFRSIAEVAPVGIVLFDMHNVPTYVNPRALEIMGLDIGDVSTSQWLSMTHPEDRDEVLDSLRRFEQSEVPEHTSEHRIVRPDESVRLVRTITRWRQTATGERLSKVMVIDDISREHMLESRLQQSQKLEAIGQLAGGIAHDFNNLLTVISGNLQFVRSELESEHPAHSDLTEIEAAAERARLLVRQLLAFGRRQVMQSQQVDAGAALRQAERWFTRVLGDEIRVVISIEERGRPLLVKVDPTQLDQVLINLAVNARDAMLSPSPGKARGGVLKLSADRLSLSPRDASAWEPLPAGRYVRIVVRDSGRGMDAETLAHAFEPFFTTKQVGEGTGLGLATVEGIIAQSGGAIRCESTVGVGTCFTIMLPEWQESGAGAGATITSDVVERRARPSGLILLAEDEEAVRRMARRILERAGYTVVEASNGDEALSMWGKHRDQVLALVSDVRMPLVGGFELAAKLREERRSLPVVFMTGFNDQADRVPGQGELLLEKPFTGDELVRSIRDVSWRARQA